MSRIRIGLLSLLAVFAFSAVAAAAAQAEVPTYSYKGAELSGKLEIKSKSGVSRLWVSALKQVIVCTADTDTGWINQVSGEAGTNEKVTVTYTGCKLYEAKWNATTKLWEVGSAYSACTVNGPSTEPAGTIKTKELKSRLAYWPPGPESIVVDHFEPEAGEVFVTIVISGCALDGTYEVKGSVIGQVTPINKEEKVLTLTFAVTKTVEKEVTQSPEEYQLEENPTNCTEVKPRVKDTLKFGPYAAAIESIDEVELVNGKAFDVSSKC
jgi:hypothetical protein